jgi:hypothetical protein
MEAKGIWKPVWWSGEVKNGKTPSHSFELYGTVDCGACRYPALISFAKVSTTRMCGLEGNIQKVECE